MREHPKNPSIYTQVPTSVLNQLKKKFTNYRETPFTFVETSHRSKQYKQLNSETTQLIKKYLHAQDYVCLLMPTGTAIPAFYFNIVQKQSKVGFCEFDNSQQQYYTQMLKYHKNTQKINNNQQLSEMISNASAQKCRTILHINYISNGRLVKMPEIEKGDQQYVTLIQNLNYCFPWSKDMKITSDIAYFSTQTGFSIPGFDVVLIKSGIIQKLPNNQHCSDMFCFNLMNKQQSVVNTPFTLCTFVLYQHLRYALDNTRKIQEKIRLNKKKFVKRINQIGCTVDRLNCEVENMIIVNLRNLDNQQKLKIIQQGNGWKIDENNKFCFFIQSQNSSLEEYLATSP